LTSGGSFTKSCVVSRHRTQRCLRRETSANLAPTFTSIDDLVQLGLAYGANPGRALEDGAAPARQRPPHAIGAAEDPLPLEMVQVVLGQTSLHTTTIYVRSANKRMMEGTAAMVRFEDVESKAP